MLSGIGRMRLLGGAGALAVQVVIDADGLPREPLLLTRVQEPALTYSVLETIRDWRFRPATSNGKPVPCLFTLTVNFKLTDG